MNKRVFFLLIGFLLVSLCVCPIFPILSFIPTPTHSMDATKTLELDTNKPPPILIDDPLFFYSWDDREPFRSNLSTSAQSVLSELSGATIYHLALSFGDPPVHVLGVEEIHYINTETVSLYEIDVALFPRLLGGNLEIAQVTIDGSSVIPEFEGWLMRLILERPLPVGEAVTLQIEFSVDVPSGGGDLYYGIFGYNNDILSFSHAYPTILVYNEEGWNNQTPDLDGDPLFSDTSFYLVSIDAPVEYTFVTSGIELEHNEASNRQHIFLADGPARDFYLAASKDLKKQTESVRDVFVNSYSSVINIPQSMDVLDFATTAIDIFSSRYGNYPYTEFDIVPIITSAGGVEYPGLTSISDQAYAWGEFLEIVIVHEIAHMWFYNLVGNDTLDQPWLDESLAQFATWQYFLDRYGEAEADLFARIDLQATWEMAGDLHTPIGLPVANYRGDDYASIVYGRGPFFIMELRDQMGIEAFDKFLRDYVKYYSWNISTTEGFKTLAEQTCGCNLTLLFTDWVYP